VLDGVRFVKVPWYAANSRLYKRTPETRRRHLGTNLCVVNCVLISGARAGLDNPTGPGSESDHAQTRRRCQRGFSGFVRRLPAPSLCGAWRTRVFDFAADLRGPACGSSPFGCIAGISGRATHLAPEDPVDLGFAG